MRAPTDASDDEDVEPRSGGVNPIGLPLSQLKKLKMKFVDANGKMLKLTLDMFVEALTANQPPAETSMQREQLQSELCTLFNKIDASCNGTVDWEEFTEYMLLHMPGLNVGDGTVELTHRPEVVDGLVGAWGSGHADMISAVTVISDAGGSGTGGGGGGRKYITAGRDGFVKVWHPNLTVYRNIDVGQHKHRWLTACIWMQKSRRLAVASSNYKIFFYDGAFSPVPITFIEHKDGTPLCLGYRESTESDGREKEILMVGDNKGFVTVYPFDEDWTSHESKADNDWEALPFKKKKPLRTKYHDGWVTKVGFVSELQAMVTCGLDGEINLCDVHLNQRKEVQGGAAAIKLHKKYGVHAWCWCRSYKFFASGGLDRQIIIWNPYTRMAMNYLQGHNAPILDVQVNETQHQLISMSVDKVIKVWDIQHYRCIQTFTDKTEYKPEDRLTCMAFDEELPGLVMCSSTINVLPMSIKVETSRTHVAPIVGALYNDVFYQIVSGDSLGTVCVWDVRSGHLEFEFKRAHGEHKMTCLAFDVSKRRLYTGAEDGEVRLWNFSSGQHLKTYTMNQSAEINGLLWAQTALASPEGPNTFIVALALDRKVYVWPGTARYTSGNAIEPKYVLEDTHGTGHTDDVSCICNISTVGGLLATGGDDGCVVLWKIQETLTSASPIACRLCDTSNGPVKPSERRPGASPASSPPQRKPMTARPGAGGGATAPSSGAPSASGAPSPGGGAVSSTATGAAAGATAAAGPGAAGGAATAGRTGATAAPSGSSAAAAGATTAAGGSGPGAGVAGGPSSRPGPSGAAPASADGGEADLASTATVAATVAAAASATGSGTRGATTRGSFMPQGGADSAAGGAPGGAAAAGGGAPVAGSAGGGAGADKEKGGDVLSEEFGFEDEHAATPASLEHLVYLEHKDCLLSTHADRKLRLWSRSDFLQVVDLVAPARDLADKVAFDGGFDRDGYGKGLGGATSSSSPSGPPVASVQKVAPGYVNIQTTLITTLYVDKELNKWLFTGDQDGFVRVFDLVPLRPPQPVRHLVRLYELQPHREAVTHLQHFDLDRYTVVMSAGADWTIVLSNLQGERIGTFNGKGPHWCLSERSTWCTTAPILEDGPRPPGQDDGWSLSPRRPGKGMSASRNRATAGDVRGAGPGGVAGRTSQLRTRPVVAAQSHCGRGIFKSLSAVERFKPDPTIVAQENAFLNAQENAFLESTVRKQDTRRS